MDRLSTKKTDKCDNCFKCKSEAFHQKCNVTRKNTLIAGWKLKALIEKKELEGNKAELEDDSHYSVCYTVQRMVEEMKLPSSTKNRKNTEENDENEEIDDNNNNDQPRKKQRTERKQVLYNNIIDDIKKMGYKKPHTKLVTREQDRRTRDLAEIIIAASIDKKELEKNGLEYVEGNLYLASNIKLLLDAITNKCESILQLNFTKEIENVTNDDLPPDEELVLAEEPEF